VLFFGGSENPPCIVTEYCEGGSLYDYLTKSRQIDPYFIVNVVQGTASGKIAEEITDINDDV
jgi:serine/threonine protein kinase